MIKNIEFTIQIRIDNEDDFSKKDFFRELERFADERLFGTKWQYLCFEKSNYDTEIKTIFCHSCEEEYTHISENGEDFKCLVCESKKIREVIRENPPY